MLEQFEVQRARTLHARRNSALAFEALRDVEVAALRRMFPDKVIERREDDYVLR